MRLRGRCYGAAALLVAPILHQGAALSAGSAAAAPAPMVASGLQNTSTASLMRTEEPVPAPRPTGAVSAVGGVVTNRTSLAVVPLQQYYIPSGWHAAALLSCLALLATAPILLREGPKAFASTLAYVACLVLVKLLVKDALGSGYPYPYTITAGHMLITAVAASLFDRPRLREALRVLPISLVSALSLAFNNTALVFGSAAFVTMIGASTPVITYLLELGRSGSLSDKPGRSLAVAVVCAGAVLCMKGESSFSAFAMILALLANLGRSLKTVWQNDLLCVDVSACRIVAWTGTWGLALMLPAVYQREGMAAIHHFGQVSIHCKMVVIISAIVAAGLNIVQCFVLQYLGSTLQNVIGNLQILMVLLLATVWLKETVTSLQWAGVLLIVVGCVCTKVSGSKGQEGKPRAGDHKAPLRQPELSKAFAPTPAAAFPAFPASHSYGSLPTER